MSRGKLITRLDLLSFTVPFISKDGVAQGVAQMAQSLSLLHRSDGVRLLCLWIRNNGPVLTSAASVAPQQDSVQENSNKIGFHAHWR